MPVDGILRFHLPATTSLEKSRLRNNCYRLEYSQSNLPLDCEGNEDDNYFDVFIKSNTFGSSGLTGGEPFIVRVGGIKNPREINSQAVFSVEAFASGERLID